jgi:RecA-family ATPase
MAKREDYLTPETLAAADEIDRVLAGMQPTSTYQEPVAEVHVNDAINDPLPPPLFIDLFQVMAEASDLSTLPPVLLEGILHKGCKMIISGSSKAGKTLALMHLGLAAANGLSWMGHKINRKCKVIYLDFELIPRLAKERIKDVMNSPANEYFQTTNFRYCGLRGQKRSLEDLALHIQAIKDFEPDMVIVDPFYKLGGDYDENDAGSVSKVLDVMESFSERLGCAFVYAHHFSKGNKAETDHIDRASGSGVFARDPDAILTLTPHEEEHHLVLEGSLRNFASPEKKVVEFSWPNFIHKTDLEPTLRKAGQASENRKTNERLADTLIRELKLQTRKIDSQTKLIELLQKVTNIDIGEKKIKAIIKACGDRIVQEKQGNGNGILYSANFELEAE